MNCRNCGYELEKDWKACPLCKEQINNKKVLLSLIVVIFIFITTILFIIINEKADVKKNLEEKYDEEFNQISLVESIDNPDSSFFSCDGASFGTIKGKGNTEYYLVYSQKNNLEFTVTYNTYTKEYDDDYEASLSLRNNAQLLYEKTLDLFNDYINEVTLSSSISSENSTLVNIYSVEELIDILSTLSDAQQISLDERRAYLYIYINQDSLEFCKNEYDNLITLNQYYKELRDNTTLTTFTVDIYTSNGSRISFSRSGVYIHDDEILGAYNSEALDDFIERDSY